MAEEKAKKKKEQEQEEGREPRRRAAPRSFWSGTISFGLINVPVQLFPATRGAGVSLRMLDGDGTPLARRYYCPAHNRLVEREEIVRGHEVGDGEFVVVSDEELQAIEPKKTREIDLRRFVDLAAIPPLLFERAYFLTPAGDSNKAYRLLADVMERTERAGIATFVMRNREYLVAILAERGILRAETLRFRDELRDPGAMGLEEPEKPHAAEVRRFEEAIEQSSSRSLDLEEMKDDYSRALRDLANEKRRRGEDVIETGGRAEEPEEFEDFEELEEVDLLEAIRASLQGGNGAAGENGGGSGNGGAERQRRERLEQLSKAELYDRAKKRKVPGRSRMNRDDLISALRRRPPSSGS